MAVLNPLFLFDMQNLLTLVRTPKIPIMKNENYTLLIPIHNRKIDDNLYKQILENTQKTIIVDDSDIKNEFMQKYIKYIKKQGILIIKKEGVGFKWNALNNALKYIKTKYVIFLDDDTYSIKDFSYLAGGLQQFNADIASVNVYPSNRGNLIEELQNIEYRIAMLGRQNRSWLTSGACIVTKTTVIKEIFKNHSGFREGGDIEIGLVAKKLKYKIIHLEYNVYTEVPNTWKEWFKQRKLWMGGNFRHVVVNMFSGKRDIFYFFYFYILIWTHILVRYYLLFLYPIIFFFIVLLYIPLTIIGNVKIIKKIFKFPILIFPLYSLFQVMIISIFGVFTYINGAQKQHNFGFFKI